MNKTGETRIATTLRRFKPYPAYMESGIEWLGKVPKHWKVMRLRHVGDAIIGLTYDPADVVDEHEGTLLLRASNVQDGRIVLEDNVFVRAKIPERLVTKIGDILICSRSGSRALIGKSAKIDENSAGITFGTFMTIFRSASNDYLFYVCNSELFDYQSGMFLTSTINQITIGNLYSFEVPVPPSTEQSAIAAFLDRETERIDQLIAKKERQINLLQEKRSALISHVVTKGLNSKAKMKDSGIEWLGEIPEHWTVIPLRWYFKIGSGEFISHEDMENERDEQNNKPVIGGNGVMGYTQKANVVQPTVVVGRVGALCGNVHVVSGPAWITDNALLLTDIRNFSYEYLALLLRMMNLNRLANKNAQPLVTGGMIKDQKTVIPPLDEQNRIVKHCTHEIDRIDSLATKISSSIDKLREYRTALISAAVTGKIDIREEAA